MEQEQFTMQEKGESPGGEIRSVVREALEEYLSIQRAKDEPAYKVELTEERKRREQLELRVNELVAENERSRRMAEEAERSAAIRDELRRRGVSKIDLAYRAVKDDVFRSDDGKLAARTEGGVVSLQEYVQRFAQENPELLPARIPGGSGASSGSGGDRLEGGIDLNRIRPGMDKEELERARRRIAEVISGQAHNL